MFISLSGQFPLMSIITRFEFKPSKSDFLLSSPSSKCRIQLLPFMSYFPYPGWNLMFSIDYFNFLAILPCSSCFDNHLLEILRSSNWNFLLHIQSLLKSLCSFLDYDNRSNALALYFGELKQNFQDMLRFEPPTSCAESAPRHSIR